VPGERGELATERAGRVEREMPELLVDELLDARRARGLAQRAELARRAHASSPRAASLSPLLAEVLGERDEPQRTGTDDDEEDAGSQEEIIEISDESEPAPETEEAGSPPPAPTPPRGQQTLSGDSVVRPSILKVTNPFVPGSYATGTVRVSNTGGSEFLFSVSVTSTGSSALAGVLKLRIADASGASCSFPGGPTSGDVFLASNATVLYVGDFASGNKVGDPSLEAAFGDQSLAPASSRLVCIELFYPWSSGNDLQGQAVLGTFIFTAKTPS